MNLHSDGLSNEPKRSHLAALHTLLLKHADAIMSVPRPITRMPLDTVAHEHAGTGTGTGPGVGTGNGSTGTGSGNGLTAFTFGPLAFLENANGDANAHANVNANDNANANANANGDANAHAHAHAHAHANANANDNDNVNADANADDDPGSQEPAHAAPVAAGSAVQAANANAAAGAQAQCGISSFPYDTSTVRYKGLVAAASAISTEAACAAACCALGFKNCAMYEFYGARAAGQATSCWVGHATHTEGTPPAHYASRSRVPQPQPSPPPPPGPHPPPPPPSGATVLFNSRTYTLPPYSITIVNTDPASPSKGAVMYGTHNVSAAPVLTRTVRNATQAPLDWACWSELDDLVRMAGSPPSPSVVVNAPHPVEQLTLTSDRTEYLFYSAELPALHLAGPSGISSGTSSGGSSLHVALDGRISNAYTVFTDNVMLGTVNTHAHNYGAQKYSVTGNVSTSAKRLGILSMSLGMMSHVSAGHGQDYKGITGTVTANGIDITSPTSGWTHVIGLEGERRAAYTGNTSLGWAPCARSASGPLTWRKAHFTLDAQGANDFNATTVLLDASGLSRGHFYLNGVDLGKYWLIEGPSKQPTQRYYQLPTSLLKFSRQLNLLVVGDELGAQAPAEARVVFSTMVAA